MSIKTQAALALALVTMGLSPIGCPTLAAQPDKAVTQMGQSGTPPLPILFWL